jgi:L-amino acid N-acyltransferase YncA
MPMSELLLRDAAIADAEAIAAIYNDAVLNSTATFDLEPETVAARREWLAGEATRLALVAELDGSVIGWASLARWSTRGAYDRTAESSVYVAPAAKRSGVGLALAEAAVERAAGLGLGADPGDQHVKTEAGLGLAESVGFERVGVQREVGFKFGRWLDVVVCQRLV